MSLLRIVAGIIKKHFNNLTVDKTLEISEEILAQLHSYTYHHVNNERSFTVYGNEQSIQNLMKFIEESRNK